MTDEEEFSKYFLQDLKDLGATAERILKKVQDRLEDLSNTETKISI